MIRYAVLLCALVALPLHAEEAAPTAPPEAAEVEQSMTLERLNQIVTTLDAEAKTDGRVWQMQINGVPLLLITDPVNDRMRALSPVRGAEGLTPQELTRMMQANFDAALDARYAIANGTLWAAFIHPLSPLEKDQLISGLGQVVNLQQTYGTLYSGGALQYGSGDSQGLQRQLIDDLLKKGEEI